MSVKIRLTRAGAKKKPFYRIVAVDSREKRDGKYIELLGTFNPLVSPELVKLDTENIVKWLNNGALPTDTVRVILSKAGILKKLHEEKKPKAKKVTKIKKEVTPVVKKEPVKKVASKKETTTKKTTKKVGN